MTKIKTTTKRITKRELQNRIDMVLEFANQGLVWQERAGNDVEELWELAKIVGMLITGDRDCPEHYPNSTD